MYVVVKMQSLRDTSATTARSGRVKSDNFTSKNGQICSTAFADEFPDRRYSGAVKWPSQTPVFGANDDRPLRRGKDDRSVNTPPRSPALQAAMRLHAETVVERASRAERNG